MKHWYEKEPELYEDEAAFIRRRLPDVAIHREDGMVILQGQFPVHDDSGSLLRHYQLAMQFPKNYPKWVPLVVMQESGVKHEVERHMYLKGIACLCLPHEVLDYLPEGIRFEPFLNNLVRPWLVGQACYDKDKRWPWEARSHSKKGILEGLSDLLKIDDLAIVERYAKLLVRQNPAKGHEVCPCGSEKKLRDCHGEFYGQCRDILPQRAIDQYRKYFS